MPGRCGLFKRVLVTMAGLRQPVSAMADWWSRDRDSPSALKLAPLAGVVEAEGALLLHSVEGKQAGCPRADAARVAGLGRILAASY